MGTTVYFVEKCHKVCDKICLKFGEENEMPDKDCQKVGFRWHLPLFMLSRRYRYVLLEMFIKESTRI